MNLDLIREALRKREAERNLALYSGWTPLGSWKFMSPLKRTIHDLSSADLTLLDEIEAKGLFRIII